MQAIDITTDQADFIVQAARAAGGQDGGKAAGIVLASFRTRGRIVADADAPWLDTSGEWADEPLARDVVAHALDRADIGIDADALDLHANELFWDIHDAYRDAHDEAVRAVWDERGVNERPRGE